MITSDLVKPLQSKRGLGWSVTYKTSGHRYGVSGMVYVKTQSDYFTRPVSRAFLKTATLVREHRALNSAKALGVSVPEVVFFREDDGVTELVLKEILKGTTLNQYLSGSDSSAQKMEVVKNLALQIRRLHVHGWSHGALGNDHILVTPHDSVSLIDFEKMGWNPAKCRADLRRFWKRTQCLSMEQAVCFRYWYGGG